MDSNNTLYFLLHSQAELEQGSSRLAWNTERQALTLSQNQQLRLPADNPTAAITAWENTMPLALDSFNQIGRLNAAASTVEFNSGRGYLVLKDGELNDVTAPVGTLKDLSVNSQGRLAIPYSNDVDQHGLLVFHLAKRWLAQCELPAAPRRAWVDHENRVWCIGADRLMLCEGGPLPLPYQPDETRFEPLSVNPKALALSWQQTLPIGWEPLAICGDESWLYLLAHDGTGMQSILKRPLNVVEERSFTPYAIASEVPFAIDLALAAPGRLAVLAPQEAGDAEFLQRDCPVVQLKWDAETTSGEAQLVRERYPMLSLSVPRFVTSADGQLRYQAQADPDMPGIAPRPRELHALRQPRYYLDAEAMLNEIMDSGAPDTIWHRIYLDACIPAGCSIRIAARVFDSMSERGVSDPIDQPDLLWNPLPSELAFQKPLAGFQPNQRGIFETLLQRPEGPVRRLSGRYLQLKVYFTGNGRATPALHAIRVYYPRFSYQEAYLPEIYRQEFSFDPVNASGPANGADVRERLLAGLEGVLTPIESRIAASDQLVHPDACPEKQLGWLALSLGIELPPHWPLARQRRLLKCATLMQQRRGTLGGVNLMLDIATDGSVRRGEVVLVENFRLRRTMATILGRNMDDAEHPLTLGTGVSGNSIIGESLILSDMSAREFFALFAPELATEEENAAVDAFFEEYAHQVSVLLHGSGRARRNQVEETLYQEMPAHLQWRIIETEKPFVLGSSPLLSIDSYLEKQPDTKPVVLNESLIGEESLLKNPAAFSPRDINSGIST